MKKADKCSRRLSSFCQRPTLHCIVLQGIALFCTRSHTAYWTVCFALSVAITVQCPRNNATFKINRVLQNSEENMFWMHAGDGLPPFVTSFCTVFLCTEMQSKMWAAQKRCAKGPIPLNLCLYLNILHFYLFGLVFWVFLHSMRFFLPLSWPGLTHEAGKPALHCRDLHRVALHRIAENFTAQNCTKLPCNVSLSTAHTELQCTESQCTELHHT